MPNRHYETPSVEDIKSGLEVTAETAQELYDILTGKKDLSEYESVQSLRNQCFNEPGCNYERQTACNEVYETCGIEAIRLEDEYLDSFHYDIFASYLNTGDSYHNTLVWDHENQKVLVTSWGDFFEALEIRKEQERKEKETIERL